MFPLRCFVTAVLVSLTLGALLLFWALLQPGGGRWAVVYTGAGLKERKIAGMLKEKGLDCVSESTVWVLLDDFSELKQIPLDQYDDFVEPFDPRNDGYAEKLRSFFVQAGIRRFFVEREPCIICIVRCLWFYSESEICFQFETNLVNIMEYPFIHCCCPCFRMSSKCPQR